MNIIKKTSTTNRLPLNIPIDGFWQALLERRKAGANLLPLHNAMGKPYWYTLTPKMIAASERLSQEAILQDKRVDPYQMKMTSAMTSEMYFTSYVEGAKISIEGAMDFLSRGTPPENVLEQLIWNNRQAWDWMIHHLYRPISEESVSFLAYTLTDGMENAAEAYRQTDYHPIPAMQDESYQVPPASRIPALMYEYYRFMNDPNVHPLIKASAGAAFLLVTRPFPEGNERLSRMISSMVLLRSGYGFFSDVSLSSVIAKETWQYYQNLCEILREDNEGDLTYFMEYFLEMLVRALDQMQEQKRHLEEETVENLLSQERQMAKEPIKAGKVTALDQSSPPEPDGGGIEDISNHLTLDSIEKNSSLGNDPMWLLEQYPSIQQKVMEGNGSSDLSKIITSIDRWINDLKVDRIPPAFKERLQMMLLKTGGIRSIRLVAFLIPWITEGNDTFYAREYKDMLGLSKNQCCADVRLAKDYGLLCAQGKGNNIYNEIMTDPCKVSLIEDGIEADSSVNKEAKSIKKVPEQNDSK